MSGKAQRKLGKQICEGIYYPTLKSYELAAAIILVTVFYTIVLYIKYFILQYPASLIVTDIKMIGTIFILIFGPLYLISKIFDTLIHFDNKRIDNKREGKAGLDESTRDKK